MRISTATLIYFFVAFHSYSNIVIGQRTFANPAVSDPAPCACDLRAGACDPNCCCDPDCSDDDLRVSPVCQSVRTSSSSPPVEKNLRTWNCSNTTSAALYDYFPFVCVQLTLNEVIGDYYGHENVRFVNTLDQAIELRSTFVSDYPNLFQPATLSTPAFSGNYIRGAPVQASAAVPFTLPGSLLGVACQQNVQVLFGVNRDISCATSSFSGNLCTQIAGITSILSGGSTTATVPINFLTAIYNPSTVTRSLTQEYYFQDNYTLSINNIPSTNGTIYDYCPGEYPRSRTQRYRFVCPTTSIANTACSGYQTWSGCPLRDSLQYSTINNTFFTARASTTDGSTDFSDFSGATSVASISCPNNIRRVLYRFTYSSVDNTISAVNTYVLYDTSSSAPRITIEWIDAAASTTSTNIPRGYLQDEPLQFQRNDNSSDVSVLVPTANGLCVDATRQTIGYKQSISSACFIQLTQSTIQQCHDLKLNLYLYLNVFFAPASAVLSYPNGSAAPIQIRDTNQDLADLDRIDVTRPNNRLDNSTIIRTSPLIPGYSIYDTIGTLPVCFNVTSGINIEFGFIRINISSTVSYERIVSVRYNYTYSNWQFDCTSGSCASTSTQRYLITFQSSFVDYTNQVFNLGDTTRADLTAADNYIQHLLWLITPEYQGESGNRNYTIAMILIFIGICVVVLHTMLFGIMFPF